MNYGPLIFLAAFFALAGSWFGFVLTPQMQVGQLQQTNTVPDGVAYHSQQVRQTGTEAEVLLTEIGTNQAAVVKMIATVKTNFSDADLNASLPLTVLRGEDKPQSD